MIRSILFITIIISCFGHACKETEKIEVNNNNPAFTNPPDWAKTAIWYEVAVERFYNGDKSNDPSPTYMKGAYPGFVPEDWTTTPWTHDWYKEDPYIKNTDNNKDFYGNKLNSFTQKAILRRYGGDLQGVLDKVEYLDSLGITAIYFRPLNDSPSHHKYDARNWRHIDRNFGPDPIKDSQTISSETPDDPSTWQWTEADKLFLELIDTLHQRGIKLILDYSFNHTGKTFWAWEDILEKGDQSKYKDWYWIDQFDNKNTNENEFKYHGWLGVHELPEIKETQKQDLSKSLTSFEGNIYSQEVKDHIYALTARWLDPNNDGDPSDGIDGYRLDVAAETPLGFWREFREHVKRINPDAYLLGEIWWEEWPDKLLDPEPYLQGDIFDAVMNYRWYRSARHFLNEAPYKISKSEFLDSLDSFSSNLRPENNYSMMNLNGSFDTPRVLTSLYNKNKYKYNCSPGSDSTYKINKPDQETYQTFKMLLCHQYTFVGAPHIYAGDEMGMWGADDPSPRKPLIWPEFEFESEEVHPLGLEKPIDPVEFDQELFSYYQKLIRIRRENPVLSSGKFEFLNIPETDQVLAYSRFNEGEEIITLINTSNATIRLNLDIKQRSYYVNQLDNKTLSPGDVYLPVEIRGRDVMILKSVKM